LGLSFLVDTNVLLRRLEPGHPHHHDAIAGVERVIGIGEPVYVAAQNVAEFWATATRPPDRNGLGLDVAAAVAAVGRIEQTFAVLPDDPQIYDYWKRLVTLHQIIGNRIFDARLVAVMLVHGIGRILTFNAADFARYGAAVLHPSAVP
jgi:predicted nucleic acid-binding protein